MSSVSENRKGYTERQFNEAKRARKLYHIVGCPTVENFKHILCENIIRNCPVTVEDLWTRHGYSERQDGAQEAKARQVRHGGDPGGDQGKEHRVDAVYGSHVCQWNADVH